jgi:hypothetical protein
MRIVAPVGLRQNAQARLREPPRLEHRVRVHPVKHVGMAIDLWKQAGDSTPGGAPGDGHQLIGEFDMGLAVHRVHLLRKSLAWGLFAPTLFAVNSGRRRRRAHVTWASCALL